MGDNPWCGLPAQAEFVLECDRADVFEFNADPRRHSSHRVQLDILPEPFIGDPLAPIVLLSNNPGIGRRVHLKKNDEFRTRMRANLRHERSRYPFLYLDPDLKEVGRWWWIKLRQLLDRFGNEVLARSLLNVVYFPYPSETFAHRKLPLGSQQYGFRLVGRAMERKAVIVSMRPGKNRYWLEAVSGLRDYAHFYSVKNPQNPAISLNNLPRGYDEVVRAIEAAERTHQRS